VAGSSAVDAGIDALYRGPLSAFVPSRLALARTLTGAEARQIKALPKPTVVPWSVNQVFWHARHLYDGVLRTGEARRAAEIAALKGRAVDVRAATARHRGAIAKAVASAEKSAVAYGLHPGDDALRRMFEAASLASTLPEPHGRFTKPLAPAGFEALAGVALEQVTPVPASLLVHPGGKPQAGRTPVATPAEVRRAERERAVRERQKREEIKKAEATAAHARAAEARARDAWERSRREAETAEQDLARLRGTGEP
jgi:hypothetical protein